MNSTVQCHRGTILFTKQFQTINQNLFFFLFSEQISFLFFDYNLTQIQIDGHFNEHHTKINLYETKSN